ncbi:MAG: hypothetical protein ACTIJ9_17095 [Aequorivita sp.]
MKSLEQIKNELHECIDAISDKKKLALIYENTLEHLKSDSKIDDTNENDHISTSQQNGLDGILNLKRSDRNKRDKESKKSMERWFNDGGRNAC